MTKKPKINIVEVGPRDGLQNQKTIISIQDKIHFIDLLSKCGFKEIEAGAFVSPKWVPQMEGSSEVLSHFSSQTGPVTYSALVPNMKGLEQALACGVKKIAVFTAASESFNQKNINATIDESIRRFEPVVQEARKKGVEVRGYVSTAFVCPYEGEIEPAVVCSVVEKLLHLGIKDISIGDTIGKATEDQVEALLKLMKDLLPKMTCAMHFHDTYKRALANTRKSLEHGIEYFDSSVGGIGGCPYAPGASGNVATEELVRVLEDLNYDTGIDLDLLQQAAHFIHKVLGQG